MADPWEPNQRVEPFNRAARGDDGQSKDQSGSRMVEQDAPKLDAPRPSWAPEVDRAKFDRAWADEQARASEVQRQAEQDHRDRAALAEQERAVQQEAARVAQAERQAEVEQAQDEREPEPSSQGWEDQKWDPSNEPYDGIER